MSLKRHVSATAETKMNWPIICNRNKCKQILCFYSWINNCFEEIYDFLLLKENIALRKPAYQQSRYPAGNPSLTDASNAVDGLKSDLSFWGGQCAFSTYGKQTATWWVNLTSIHSIHYVTIYYMTNNRPWGMQLIINIVYVIISEQLEIHFHIDAFEHISSLFRSARLNLIKLDSSYRNMMINFLFILPMGYVGIWSFFYYSLITKLNYILWKGQPVFLCFCTFSFLHSVVVYLVYMRYWMKN